MAFLLTTTPRFDDGTEYLAYYTSLILRQAEKHSIDNKNFTGPAATGRHVSQFIQKKNPELLLINGHGSAESLEGHKNEILFSIDKNLHLLADRITYARACDAAQTLGKNAVHNNNGCFIGYERPFSFWIDERRSAVPAKDKVAALFLLPSNEVMNLLLKGNTAQEAHDRSKQKMIENMNEVLKMKDRKEPIAVSLLPVLWNNYEGQVILGNTSASC